MTKARDGTVLLRLEKASKYFPLRRALPWSPPRGYIRAVDGVSFDIKPGETVSLVGESGCGKTTTSKLILLLEQPTAGRITFQDVNIHKLEGHTLRRYRASVQAVFQDPWSSLSPRMRGRSIIAEPLVVNQRLRSSEVREEIILSGDVPSPASPPTGCRFHPRCRFTFDRCSKEAPQLRELAPGHMAACHLY